MESIVERSGSGVLRHVVEITAQKKAGWFSGCSPGDGSGSSSVTARIESGLLS